MRYPSVRSQSAKQVSSWLPAYSHASWDAHVLIASQTVGAGGAASITFSSIPQTYRALQIRGIARSAGSGTSWGSELQFNGDLSTNYVTHTLSGDGASATSGSWIAQNYIYTGTVLSTGGAANVWTGIIIDIIDYANTSNNTTTRMLSGYDANGSGAVVLRSGLWLNAAAVTSIILTDGSANVAAGTTYALYGIL